MADLSVELKFSARLSRLDVDRGRSVRLRMRRAIGKWLEHYIRDRVHNRGEGAYGALKPYSVTPVLIGWPRPGDLKPIIPPKGGVKTKKGMFFTKGYAEYKRLTGQVADRFTLTNKGNLWEDWQYFESNSLTEPIQLGFTDPRNTEVARVERFEHDRPGIFALDSKGRRMLTKFTEIWLRDNL